MEGLLDNIYQDRLNKLRKEVEKVKQIKTMTVSLDTLMLGIAREIVSSRVIIDEIKGERSPITFKNLITVMCIDDNGVRRAAGFRESEEYKQLVALYRQYGAEVNKQIEVVKQDLLKSCKVYEQSESKLYCTNKNQEGYTKVIDPKENITCPEVLLYTQDRQGIWVLESVSCVEEVQRRNFESMLRGEEKKVYDFPLLRGIVTEPTFLMLDEN